MPTDEAFKRRLTVTSQREISTWDNGKGGQTTLYEVTAVDEHGSAIEVPLRAFSELEEGVLIEYRVEPYEHPKSHEKSYTLKRPKHNTTARVVALEKAVQDLSDRLAAVEAQAGIEPPPPPQEDQGGEGQPF